MGDGKKSGIQKLFTRLVPSSMAANMEAESRTWIARCPYCGYERSYWEMGGVRYKASGNSRQLMRCLQCGRMSWHIIYRRKAPPGVQPTAMPLADSSRRELLWALGLGALVAGIAAFILILLLVLANLTLPVVNAGDAFMTALKTADYAQAYALCTPDLQKDWAAWTAPRPWCKDTSPPSGTGRAAASITIWAGWMAQ